MGRLGAVTVGEGEMSVTRILSFFSLCFQNLSLRGYLKKRPVPLEMDLTFITQSEF